MNLPLTTRSAHSQAILTIRKNKTNGPMDQSSSVQDGSEIPAYHMDAQNSSRAEMIGPGSAGAISHGTHTPTGY